MPKAPPTTDDISIPVLLRHARDVYGSAMRSALDDAGYDDVPKHGQYVLGGLALLQGGRPLSQLIEELNITKQAVGHLIDALVVRGYLRRDVDEADRRKLTIALTERGRGAARALGKARDEIDTELLARSGSPDVERLRKTLATLIEIGRERDGSTEAPAHNRAADAPSHFHSTSMNLQDAREAIIAKNSQLTASRFETVGLANSVFDDVNLQKTTFNNINFAGCSFEDVNMTDVSISNVNLTGMKINGVSVNAMMDAYRNREKKDQA